MELQISGNCPAPLHSSRYAGASSGGINDAEFDTPEPKGFTADSDASLRKEVFDVTMARVEAIVEPDCVGDNVWGEAVTFFRCSLADSTNFGDLTWRYLCK